MIACATTPLDPNFTTDSDSPTHATSTATCSDSPRLGIDPALTALTYAPGLTALADVAMAATQLPQADLPLDAPASHLEPSTNDMTVSK